MKGFLLKQQTIHIGTECFIESNALENNYCVMFEDDGETGYFYAGEKNSATAELIILDMLHIYDVDRIADAEREAKVVILWSTNWLHCALILNDYCHAVYDFSAHAGYNRNEFPPASGVWSAKERQLTDEMIANFFLP